MTSSSLPSTGVAGLGIIGRRVAENLRRKGFPVTAWNRTPHPDLPDLAKSPAAVAAASDIIQIFVTDGEALMEVMEDMAPKLNKSKTVINCSTVSVDATHEAAELAAKKGAAFLDSPFTGSRDAAAAAELVYYVGGEREVLERARPALEASSKSILYTGPLGTATLVKIATNMVSAGIVEVLAEALGVVATYGVPLETFQAAMDLNASSSGLTRMKLKAMIAGDFTTHFSLKNMLKDSSFALQLATRAGMELPVLTATSECMAGLVAAGRGEEDYSVLAANFLPPEKILSSTADD